MSIQVAILILGIFMQVGGMIFLMNKAEGKERNIGIYVATFGFILLISIQMGAIAIGILVLRFAYGFYQDKRKED